MTSHNRKGARDYLFVHFKYANADEAFYKFRKESHAYRMKTINQQLILECSKDAQLSAKLLTFECNKIEELLLYRGDIYTGEL